MFTTKEIKKAIFHFLLRTNPKNAQKCKKIDALIFLFKSHLHTAAKYVGEKVLWDFSFIYFCLHFPLFRLLLPCLNKSLLLWKDFITKSERGKWAKRVVGFEWMKKKEKKLNSCGHNGLKINYYKRSFIIIKSIFRNFH